MSTYSIAQIPKLAPHVEHMLAGSSSLQEVSSQVLALVPTELTFSLLLATVLPVLTDTTRPVSQEVPSQLKAHRRMAADLAACLLDVYEDCCSVRACEFARDRPGDGPVQGVLHRRRVSTAYKRTFSPVPETLHSDGADPASYCSGLRSLERTLQAMLWTA
jgi:hypothetical protein